VKLFGAPELLFGRLLVTLTGCAHRCRGQAHRFGGELHTPRHVFRGARRLGRGLGGAMGFFG
jgi:hypothetical protein